ncbi:MAG: hypothetical protein N3B12_08740 [Armatimonadetes bacterium]|nr:hypothetical protein [Armatimonadota bacterium]
MNRCRLASAAAALVLVLCFTPAIAQDQPPESVTNKIESSKKIGEEEAKANEEREHNTSETKEEKRKEEVRLEVEKRRKVEMERHWRKWTQRNLHHPYHGEYYLLYSVADSLQNSASTPTESSISPQVYRQCREPEALKSYVGVVIAPGQGARKTAVGLQYLSNHNYGVASWFAGSFGLDDDVIPAEIPHSDYHTETRTGTYGIRAVFGAGSDAAMLFFGAGISVDENKRIDISNVTGWRWDGGKNITVRPAALFGCRLRTGGRLSLHLGYDTLHSVFFGVSVRF